MNNTPSEYKQLGDNGGETGDSACPMEAFCGADNIGQEGTYCAPSRDTMGNDEVENFTDGSSKAMPQPSAPPAPCQLTTTTTTTTTTERPSASQSGRSRQQIEQQRVARQQEDNEWASKAAQNPDIDTPELEARPRSFPVPALQEVYVAYNSACISWAIPPECEQMPGVFHVEVAVGAGAAFQELYSGPETHRCIDNLAPDTTYHLRANFTADGRTGPWSATKTIVTRGLPPAELVLDPLGAQPRVTCHVTTRVADYVAPQQLAAVRYEYAVKKKLEGDDRCRSFVTSNATHTIELEAATAYKLRCRVLVEDDAGPWSREELVRTLEPHATRVARLAGGHALWAWEALFYVLAVVLAATFGEYLDEGSTAPATAALALVLVYEASLAAYPLVVHRHRNWAQPPFLQLLFRPLGLTKQSPCENSQRIAVRVYGALLGTHWLLVLAALLVALLRLNRAGGATWFASAIMLALAFTVVPALALPLLFWARIKGRGALLFATLLMLPPTGPLLYAAARADGALIEWLFPDIFATMFVGVAFIVVYAVAAVIATQSARACLFGTPFFVVVCIPTYIVLTFVLGNVMDGSDFSTFTKSFAPLYIDCILLFLVSALCHFTGHHSAVRHVLEDQCANLQAVCLVPLPEGSKDSAF